MRWGGGFRIEGGERGKRPNEEIFYDLGRARNVCRDRYNRITSVFLRVAQKSVRGRRRVASEKLHAAHIHDATRAPFLSPLPLSPPRRRQPLPLRRVLSPTHSRNARWILGSCDHPRGLAHVHSHPLSHIAARAVPHPFPRHWQRLRRDGELVRINQRSVLPISAMVVRCG